MVRNVAAMWVAFFIIGVLFGLALALTLGLFYAASLGGDFKANLRTIALELRDNVTGRRRVQAPPPAQVNDKPPEPDPRLRSLQEELRMAHRLVEHARAERLALVEKTEKAAAEAAELRQGDGERQERIAQLGAELTAQRGREENLRQQLADRGEQLARANREIRDLTNEIGLLNSDIKVVNP